MTLLTTVFAAIICTVIWYRNAPKDEMKVGILCWMYWGASLMNCHKVIELENCPLENFVPKLADGEFHVLGHRLELYGYCKDCEEKRNS